MAQQPITVTFSKKIPVATVIKMIEGNMKANTENECQVAFRDVEGDENVYTIWAETNEAFFQIGMCAAILAAKFQ